MMMEKRLGVELGMCRFWLETVVRKMGVRIVCSRQLTLKI